MERPWSPNVADRVSNCHAPFPLRSVLPCDEAFAWAVVKRFFFFAKEIFLWRSCRRLGLDQGLCRGSPTRMVTVEPEILFEVRAPRYRSITLTESLLTFNVITSVPE
jgi:hypothetical protein